MHNGRRRLRGRHAARRSLRRHLVLLLLGLALAAGTAVLVSGALGPRRPAAAAPPAVPESLTYPHEGVSVNLDSVGLFQQRPSQGWGTVAQLMDPRYSTGAFYDRLVKVSGWQALSVTDAAQAVQRSAFPGAYQKHEDTARQAVAALMP